MEKISNLLVKSQKNKECYLKIYLLVLILIFSACSSDDTQNRQTSSQVSNIQSDALDSSKTIKPQSNPNIIEKNSNIDNNATISITKKPIDAKVLYSKCVACHGTKGDVVAPGSEGKVLISQLSKDEIITNLKGYRDRSLKKGKSSAIMYLQSANLSDDEIVSLGEYISSFNK